MTVTWLNSEQLWFTHPSLPQSQLKSFSISRERLLMTPLLADDCCGRERYFSVVCWGTLVSWLFACGWSHTCVCVWCWLNLLDFFKTWSLEGDGRYIERKGDLVRGSCDEYDRQALYINLRKKCSSSCYMPESESRDAESLGHKITGWWVQRNTNHWGKKSKMTNYWNGKLL